MQVKALVGIKAYVEHCINAKSESVLCLRLKFGVK